MTLDGGPLSPEGGPADRVTLRTSFPPPPPEEVLLLPDKSRGDLINKT